MSDLNKQDTEKLNVTHIWRKKDGTMIPVAQMDTDHIINTLRMLQRNGYSKYNQNTSCFSTADLPDGAAMCLERSMELAWSNPYTPWFEIFEAELKSRGLTEPQILAIYSW
ncbi:MAG: hypothetical protein WC346_17005 [Methanogenium sp.]|jgi:hypothetical protein